MIMVSMGNKVKTSLGFFEICDRTYSADELAKWQHLRKIWTIQSKTTKSSIVYDLIWWMYLQSCGCWTQIGGCQFYHYVSNDEDLSCTVLHYLLTYIEIHGNQLPWSHSTSLLLTLACSLVEVTATRRWEEATALQLHLTAHHCCVLCHQKVLGFHHTWPNHSKSTLIPIQYHPPFFEIKFNEPNKLNLEIWNM